MFVFFSLLVSPSLAILSFFSLVPQFFFFLSSTIFSFFSSIFQFLFSHYSLSLMQLFPCFHLSYQCLGMSVFFFFSVLSLAVIVYIFLIHLLPYFCLTILFRCFTFFSYLSSFSLPLPCITSPIFIFLNNASVRFSPPPHTLSGLSGQITATQVTWTQLINEAVRYSPMPSSRTGELYH